MSAFSYRIGRVFGIPIRVHLSLLLLLPFIAWQTSRSLGESYLFGLALACCVFLSVALHELGHSLVAIWKGAKVREITLMFIGGAAQMERIPSRPVDELLMALAGPLVSLALFAVLYPLGSVLPLEGTLLRIGDSVLRRNFLQYIGMANLCLALFNILVPAFPMDGGRVLRALLTPRLGRLRATRAAMRVGSVFCAALAVIGILAIVGRIDRAYWIFLLIAIFIRSAAKSEYRTLLWRQQFEGTADGSDHYPDENEVTIGPPPYRDEPNARTPLYTERRRGPWSGLFRE